MEKGLQHENDDKIPSQVNDLLLQKYKFVVSLDDIKLKLEEATQIRITYNYQLLRNEDFCTGLFLIKPRTDESQAIGYDNNIAFWEHKLEQELDEEKLKEHFKCNILEFKLFSKNGEMGTVSLDLFKLFHPESQGVYQNTFTEWINIISKDGSTLGSMHCFIALAKEKHIICKFCNDTFEVNKIMKHISSPFKTSCKNAYSLEEIENLNCLIKERRKHKECLRKRRIYDPEKRANVHKAKYNSEKRAKKYLQDCQEISRKRREDIRAMKMMGPGVDFERAKEFLKSS